MRAWPILDKSNPEKAYLVLVVFMNFLNIDEEWKKEIRLIQSSQLF